MYHNPVLLSKSVGRVGNQRRWWYMLMLLLEAEDILGEILKRLGDKGRLLAFDQDEDALENTIDDLRFTLINENFRYITQFLKFYGIRKVGWNIG